MAGKVITNPTGAFGYTDLMTETYSQTAPFLANAAITGPAVVSITTSGNSVATTATNGTASLVVGVAVNSISSGQVGLVVVSGLAENCVADGAIAAGDLVKRSVNTAGRVQATATPAAGEVLGTAVNASAGGTVDIWVTGGKALS